MSIEQIRVGFDNFSYIIYCPVTQKAALVDPGHDPTTAIRFLTTKKLRLESVILTHYHSDHTGDIKSLKKSYPITVISSREDAPHIGVQVDRIISDGDTMRVGNVTLVFMSTPGHTPGSMSIIVDNSYLLTGDTLFIGDCGRTDLQGGDITQMFKTLHGKILLLPDHLIVYPGHDYGCAPFDTLGNQKMTNKTLLAKNLDDFSQIP